MSKPGRAMAEQQRKVYERNSIVIPKTNTRLETSGEKKKRSMKIKTDVAAYLKGGGTITQIPIGATGLDVPKTMLRKDKLPKSIL